MELFGLPGQIVVQGGAVGLLAVVVMAILLGKLVPRRVLEDEKARGDEWRAAAKAQDERNDVLSGQLAELLEVGRTTNALIQGMRQASQERRR